MTTWRALLDMKARANRARRLGEELPHYEPGRARLLAYAETLEAQAVAAAREDALRITPDGITPGYLFTLTRRRSYIRQMVASSREAINASRSVLNLIDRQAAAEASLYASTGL